MASTTSLAETPQMLTQQGGMDNLTFTHGYVHGHVHRHNDFMHIHGHIHNHDHTNQLSSADSKPAGESSAECHEFDEICRDIFCEDLDDCYFEDCISQCHEASCADDSCIARCEDVSADCCEDASADCCNDPQCLESGSIDCSAECSALREHENSLCESQKSNMELFENLLQNVQKNVEQLFQDKDQGIFQQKNHTDYGNIQLMEILEPDAKKRKVTDQKLEIHFPHPCHSAPASEGNELSSKTSLETWPIQTSKHHTHQTCFHAKVPSSTVDQTAHDLDTETSKQLKSDFDFFIQFDNFNPLNLNNQDFSAQPFFNNHFEDPGASATYPCQWEKCQTKVDDSHLVQHLVNAHIKDEYGLSSGNSLGQPPFECEWSNCNFVDEDYSAFLGHLNTHKCDPPRVELKDSIMPTDKDVSALLTPNSASELTDSPKKEVNETLLNGLNITSMKICSKSNSSDELTDPNFTCKWAVATDETGFPIVCGKTHKSEGELQHHLQDDHIGLGRSVYHCCWVGCERHQGKPFIQRQKLYRHIHIHTHYKPCKCSVCGACFAVEAILKQHMRIHSGEKPFVCDTCGKRFSTSSSLSIHNRVHSGEKPLQCTWPGCKKRFSESSNLAKHLRLHMKKFTCETCGEVFDKRTEYTKHKKLH